MTPEVTDFLPGSLEDTDKFIEVVDGHHIAAKQKGSVSIQMCNDNGKTFVAILYIVLLAPDLCDRLFSIIMLMIAGLFYDFSILFPEKACFLTALCGNVTALSSFSPKYTVQNPL